LRKREDFVKLRHEGRFFAAGGVAVQLAKRVREDEGESSGKVLRWGVTASRKVGNAVKRNRAKRRLRALWREYEGEFEKGWDVNMIAGALTVGIGWKDLRKSFRYVMKKGGVWKGAKGESRVGREDRGKRKQRREY
jgi:ribonuclease P protein component